ncbi:anti-sigma factor antagonist [Saccharophagus sp. K07]|jgi:anti-anti-sigma factor|uniref:STAS domain-containing protein n=1 Tax=Saccharophagus sp. K07 TaxID=2283636 RepID=UPI0016522B26|nr:STAS domain-containing protein [Saccharophagus sp. K07]MBC6904394.1 anti-sigma factor antagonist [Saccharophagus sp. K07]
MSSGHIYVAEHDGTYVIKLVGDVRLTLCISFDQFISTMFGEENFKTVVFDLREAEGIDSTTLGLMAKISIGSRDLGHGNPIVVASNPSIQRLLISMGFEDIFELVSDTDLPFSGTQPLPENLEDEAAIKAKVLEAHQILMDLNQPNKVKFHELVETLRGKY